MHKERIKILRQVELSKNPVVYWMSRDQRADDNWALLYSQNLALELESPLIVIFCVVPEFLNAAYRQYYFMIEGLKSLKSKLENKNIEFHLLIGSPEDKIPEFIEDNSITAIVTDFDPLKIKKQWKQSVLNKTNISFYEVDAHNIVPCQYASNKQEWAAYTFRPKINRLLEEFLDEFPELQQHPYKRALNKIGINWNKIFENINADKRVEPVSWIKSGEEHALAMLNDFIENKLDKYAELRNDPTLDFQSNMSPYLHFGQISGQRIALEVLKSKKNEDSKKAYLEELIVRRELADNFCFYNQNYDKFEAFPDWAKSSLNEHREDPRIPIFSLEDFEQENTYDNLWNASQSEMVKTGKMHGYMRMYWAKKIFEWSPSPEEALKIAIYLNDKYELDGRDPNGYTGIAWSIGGVHDRAWGARMIFGKVRYMSYKGLQSKFKIDEYIKKINQI
jgi:deoxyribodipyrimidine photo-lyase